MIGRRYTIQRELVMQAVRDCAGHATVEELYSSIAPQHPHISRATVYRNLALLEQEGHISRVSVPNAPERYELRRLPHYHFQCQRCSAVTDVDMPYQEGLICQIRSTEGCIVQSHSIIFHGICSICLNREGK